MLDGSYTYMFSTEVWYCGHSFGQYRHASLLVIGLLPYQVYPLPPKIWSGRLIFISAAKFSFELQENPSLSFLSMAYFHHFPPESCTFSCLKSRSIRCTNSFQHIFVCISTPLAYYLVACTYYFIPRTSDSYF
jgi:hypothetical protein